MVDVLTKTQYLSWFVSISVSTSWSYDLAKLQPFLEIECAKFRHIYFSLYSSIQFAYSFIAEQRSSMNLTSNKKIVFPWDSLRLYWQIAKQVKKLTKYLTEYYLSMAIHSCRLKLIKGWVTLRKKCPYLEWFWSLFSRIRPEYGEIQSMRENTDQNNSEYGHFSRSVLLSKNTLSIL